MFPSPKPPQWAVDAGLPAPNGHTFEEYVQALGLDLQELTKDLKPQTAPLANVRLATRLAKDMPAAWSAYVHERLLEAHDASEMTKLDKEQDRLARYLFAERYRPTEAFKELYGSEK